jgi:hypothetical protein
MVSLFGEILFLRLTNIECVYIQSSTKTNVSNTSCLESQVAVFDSERSDIQENRR